MLRKLALALSLSILIAGIAIPTASAASEVTSLMVPSRADDHLPIDITIYKPATASATNQVPVVLFSHGWGGNKNDGASAADSYNDAGLGYVTISQRGHGNTGGLRNVQDPQLEAQDIMAVIDHIATLDWVLLDKDSAGAPIAGDPMLGAIGGSYGGGYQTITALQETKEKGVTRFNALAPEITWYDLPTSLAPEGVPRTAWITALYAAAKAPCVLAGVQQQRFPSSPSECESKIPDFIDQSFEWGAATGQWPAREEPWAAAEEAAGVPDMTTKFRAHSPRGFVEMTPSVKIDVPVLQRQGATDNLFNLNEGLNIFNKALTENARAKSIFTSYNGGHILPAVGSTLPIGSAPSGDPCNNNYTGGWDKKRIDFFKAVFAGLNPRVALNQKAFSLATEDGDCRRLDALPSTVEVDVDPTGFGYWGSPSGAFAPQSQLLANGPISIAGIPRIKGGLYNFGADTRSFFALSVGTAANGCATAKVVQNNMMPLREFMPQTTIDGTGFNEEIPAVAVDVTADEVLCLTMSPVSDASFGHSSRTPGLQGFDDLSVILPKVVVN